MKGTISCEGKREYSDFNTARKFAKRTNDGRDINVSPYRCRFCHHWHLGGGIVPKTRKPTYTEEA